MGKRCALRVRLRSKSRMHACPQESASHEKGTIMAHIPRPGEPVKPGEFTIGPRFTTQVNAPGWEFNDTTEFLQVTRGCSHNACRFCAFYKNLSYAEIDMDEVEFYIEYLALRDKEVPVYRVFLESSNAFHLSYDKLMRIAELLHKSLPNLQTIGSYGRISDLRDKSVEQLRALHDASYSNIFFGVESADERLLTLMRKGYGESELYEAGAKLKESGLPWSCPIMIGMGGHGYGFDHAIKTADFFNFAEPGVIGAVSLTITRDPYSGIMPPLMKAIERGEFVEAGEIERYEEMRAFIEHLNIKTLFMSGHSTMPYGFTANLPEYKDELISRITRIIETGNEEIMRKFRERVEEV